MQSCSTFNSSFAMFPDLLSQCRDKQMLKGRFEPCFYNADVSDAYRRTCTIETLAGDSRQIEHAKLCNTVSCSYMP